MRLIHGDCLDVMPTLPQGCVDLILCDLPYGTTSCGWDAVIPFDALWDCYRHVAKPNAAIVLFAAQPFSSALTTSNVAMFRYEWVWAKNHGSGFALARYQPMRHHEAILVFYETRPTYNPQRTRRQSTSSEDRMRYVFNGAGGGDHTPVAAIERRYDPASKGPESVLSFTCVPNGGGGHLHPTQKPVALLEYLIRTYTNPFDTVLDNCMGSGSTGVACLNTGREFIGIEKDATYFSLAENRIREAQQQTTIFGD